ncbi:unnamed protein product [Peniophora sp. CBMAI 1063]|nr:unnamed protein product [Peniophora sp. CBMAI 1063]
MPLLRRATAGLRKAHVRHASSKASVTIGLRQEDPERVWERRSPLTPDAVADLIAKDGVRVLVQECDKRVFPLDDYVHAGAEVHPTLEPAHLIMGIKETPLNSLITSPVPSPVASGLVPRTHLMFSHTIKGQEYNMPLLSRFLADGDAFHAGAKSEPGLEARLIDYELLTDESGKRTVMFGFYAGVAGALESLSAMAHKHLEHGVASAFLYTPRPHASPSLDTHRSQLRYIASQIAEHGTPKSLGPCIIGVTGRGNVTEGVMSILEELPLQHVTADDLPNLVSNPETDLRKIYLLHALPPSYITHSNGAAYQREDYYANPQAYQSHFHTKIAPYLTLLINGAGWAPGFPRLLTNEQLPLARRLAAIGDISCDIGGGLEFVTKASTLSSPTFDVGGVSIMSVDILPASLPADASAAFTGKVLRYVRTLVGEYRGQEATDVEAARALDRATVARGGHLSEGFTWLQEKVDTWRTSARSQGAGATIHKPRVLVLGSGMVAGPCVDDLAGPGDLDVVVASNILAEAESLVAHHGNHAQAVSVDMNNASEVDRLVSQADVVISLLPAPFHPTVAELCLTHHKHLVTASYISPAMHALHTRATDGDVLLLNEIGLDPGIDHCSAHAMLERIRGSGGSVRSFVSFCGGLPAPDAAEGVPLGYKFSWSPRGVLRAANENAHFLLDGKEISIPGEKILAHHFTDVPVSDVLRLEGLANRDSMPYVKTYQLPSPQDGLHTMLRGTLRYPGFAQLMQSFKDAGFLESIDTIAVENWSSFTHAALSLKTGVPIPSDERSLLAALSERLGAERAEVAWDALQKLGLVPSSTSPMASAVDAPKPPRSPLPPVDLLAAYLAHTLRYGPGERDLVVLAHEVLAASPSGDSLEVHTSRLTVYGDEKATAMARTVGLPVAFATRAVLSGAVRTRGVAGPTADNAVWKGVLEGLERVGLGMREDVRRVPTTSTGIVGTLALGLQSTRGE